MRDRRSGAHDLAWMRIAVVNHRDCYICHFLLHTDTPVTADTCKLSVIDLHCAQTRDKISHRWRDKDLAVLYFSARHLNARSSNMFNVLIHAFKIFFPSTHGGKL